MRRNFKDYLSIIFRGWIGSILITLLIVTSFKSAIADWYVVPTGSMKPTIIEGDRILTNKLAYNLRIPFTTMQIVRWGSPSRGDIVVFNSPNDGKCLVKRVVGLPGDTIAMNNNRLYINGEQLGYESLAQESLGTSLPIDDVGLQFYREDLTGHKHTTMVTPFRPSMRTFPPVAVPDHHYFMMGDNRDNSADSRYFGFVDQKEILGQATAIVISLDIGNYYQPRWPRFFTKLR
jgi:signal peptidase I